MLPEERHQALIEMLEHQPVLKVSDLVSVFGVSTETIRRDLDKLAQMGLVERVYGGAVKNRVSAIEPKYEDRAHGFAREKDAIGRKAAALVEDGDTVALDIGTTVLSLARALRPKQGLFVITNSLVIAEELLSHGNKTVVAIGGEVRPGEMTTSGPIATDMLRNFRVKRSFIGAAGFTVEDGLTDYNLPEAEVRRAMIEISEESVVLADSSKMGLAALFRVAPVSKFKLLVTDWRAPAADLDRFRESGLQVVVADEPPQEDGPPAR